MKEQTLLRLYDNFRSVHKKCIVLCILTTAVDQSINKLTNADSYFTICKLYVTIHFPSFTLLDNARKGLISEHEVWRATYGVRAFSTSYHSFLSVCIHTFIYIYTPTRNSFFLLKPESMTLSNTKITLRKQNK